MQLRLQLFIALASIVLFLSVLELIRQRQLRQQYALLWLLSAAVVFLLAIFKGSVHTLANLFQVEYPPSLIFVVGLGFVIAIQLEQAVTISRLSRQNRELAQKLAIHEWQLRQSRVQHSHIEEVDKETPNSKFSAARVQPSSGQQLPLHFNSGNTEKYEQA